MTLTDLLDALRSRSPGALELVREINKINGEQMTEQIERYYRRRLIARHADMCERGAQSAGAKEQT